VVLSVEGQAPTGDEPLLGREQWNLGGSIALIKTIDPVVIFGGGSDTPRRSNATIATPATRCFTNSASATHSTIG
jgi:hypothetical protein